MILPTLFSIAVNLYVLPPFTEWNRISDPSDDGIPKFWLPLEWAYGVMYCNITYRVIRYFPHITWNVAFDEVGHLSSFNSLF
jgi:hypothetical protein